MDKATGKKILDEVLGKVQPWEPIEAFKDKEGNKHPVIFFNIQFVEGKACVLRYKVSKTKFDIYVAPSEEDPKNLDFGIVCGPWEEWFSSPDLKECIKFAKDWFEKK